MKKTSAFILFFLCFILLLNACKKELDYSNPYIINFTSPKYFPEFEQPANNPLTSTGLKLGRMLFYDPILSSDSTISCASCHSPSYSFADNKRFSVGVNGAQGNIQSMALINLAWQKKLFWNGRASSLEEQAIEPILNPIEMHETPEGVVNKLRRHPTYPELFKLAFNTNVITKEQIAKAIAQFERTMISSNSRFDGYIDNGTAIFKSALEFEGFNIFFKERGQCFHCHGGNGTFLAHNLDTIFRNNGLLSDAEMAGTGLYQVTGNKNDEGLFKVPTLRNVEFTAPYMHDGRFNTLEEVVEFYSSGIKQNKNLDINFTKIPDRLEEFGGLGFTQREKEALVAFLKMFSDTTFINNPAFANPFK